MRKSTCQQSTNCTVQRIFLSKTLPTKLNGRFGSPDISPYSPATFIHRLDHLLVDCDCPQRCTTWLWVSIQYRRIQALQSVSIIHTKKHIMVSTSAGEKHMVWTNDWLVWEQLQNVVSSAIEGLQTSLYAMTYMRRITRVVRDMTRTRMYFRLVRFDHPIGVSSYEVDSILSASHQRL